jgi:hypothetical protein
VHAHTRAPAVGKAGLLQRTLAVTSRAVLCHAVLCHAVLCHAVLCHAVLQGHQARQLAVGCEGARQAQRLWAVQAGEQTQPCCAFLFALLRLLARTSPPSLPPFLCYPLPLLHSPAEICNLSLSVAPSLLLPSLRLVVFDLHTVHESNAVTTCTPPSPHPFFVYASIMVKVQCATRWSTAMLR